MSDTEKAEAARVRRRWINLGELLAVVAVLISALTFWNSWRERTATEAKDARTEAKAQASATTIALGAAAADDGRRLSLASLHSDQTIQGQTLLFPPALKVSTVETTGDPRIEADWLSDALKKAEKDAGEPRAGDRRLPVLIVTRFLSDGDVNIARGYYDIGYALEDGGFLGGRKLRLKGLSYVAGAGARADPARLDRLWTARK